MAKETKEQKEEKMYKEVRRKRRINEELTEKEESWVQKRFRSQMNTLNKGFPSSAEEVNQ